MVFGDGSKFGGCSIEKWTVDTGRMTMTYYDKAGSAMLVEQIK